MEGSAIRAESKNVCMYVQRDTTEKQYFYAEAVSLKKKNPWIAQWLRNLYSPIL